MKNGSQVIKVCSSHHKGIGHRVLIWVSAYVGRNVVSLEWPVMDINIGVSTFPK